MRTISTITFILFYSNLDTLKTDKDLIFEESNEQSNHI